MSVANELPRFVLLSGCSGGGKSTLLAELADRGFAVVEEPGRRIVEAQNDAASPLLPWIDLAQFARAAVDLAIEDFQRASEREEGVVFFDRGLIDALVALRHAAGCSQTETLAARYRYNPLAFFVPPWPEIYARDHGRRHGLSEAVAEYHRLLEGYSTFGYRTQVLPKVGVAERADVILSHLGIV